MTQSSGRRAGDATRERCDSPVRHARSVRLQLLDDTEAIHDLPVPAQTPICEAVRGHARGLDARAGRSEAPADHRDVSRARPMSPRPHRDPRTVRRSRSIDQETARVRVAGDSRSPHNRAFAPPMDHPDHARSCTRRREIFPTGFDVTRIPHIADEIGEQSLAR